MAQQQPIDLNILPDQYQPFRVTGLTVAAILIAAALVLGLIPAYAVLTLERRRTADVQDRLSEVEAALSEAKAARSKLADVNQQIEEARARIAALEEQMGALGEWRAPRSTAIATAVKASGADVHLTDITQLKETFVLGGEAADQALVLEYAHALRESGRFANVRVLSMVNPDTSGRASKVDFSISVER